MTQSDTPRTDVLRASLIARGSLQGRWLIEMTDLARQLERELSAMTTLNREHVRQLNERDNGGYEGQTPSSLF